MKNNGVLNKYVRLKKILEKLYYVGVASPGGLDSSFLLKVAAVDLEGYHSAGRK